MAVGAVYLGSVIANLLLKTAYALIGPRLAPGHAPPPKATKAAMALLRRGADLQAGPEVMRPERP